MFLFVFPLEFKLHSWEFLLYIWASRTGIKACSCCSINVFKWMSESWILIHLRILSKALLKITLFSWNSLYCKMKQVCANNILFGFFAEKDMNELMEESFESVSSDLWTRTLDMKGGFGSKLCPLVSGPLSPEQWSDQVWPSHSPVSPPRREYSDRRILVTSELWISVSY